MRLTIVRHAYAGTKRRWTGPDEERPLDARGRRQALGLAPILATHDVARILSSPARRCIQTVRPLADLVDLEVETWPLLGPDGAGGDVVAACFASPAHDAAVLCTHGEVMQQLLSLDGIQRAARVRHLTRAALLTKGTAWRLHLTDVGEVTKLVHLTPRS